MPIFRAYVAILFVTIVIYTAIVMSIHGADFLPDFLAAVTAITWAGQFNMDFMIYLGISAIWIAWRHRFTPAGLALGLCGLVGGALFLLPYLFIVAGKAKGDATTLLLGPERTSTNA